MPDTLATLSAYRPVSVCHLPSGDVLFANGLDPAKRWNGVSETLQNAGIPAPTNGSFGATGSGTGTIDGDYVIAVRFVDADGNVGDLGELVSFTGTTDATVTYSNIPVSSDSRVTKREIYRSTEGQSITLYLVTTINDNTTTTYNADTFTDDDLAEQDDLPVTNPDASPNARRFGVPPSWKRQVLNHLGFTFWLGNVEYSEGHLEVTDASATVQGRGTHFTAEMVDRKLHVTNHAKTYTISAVNTTDQTLTLSGNYTGDTDKFATYAIKVEPEETSLVYYSSADEPEAVYALNSSIIEGAEDGEITGGFVLGSQLYVMRERQLRVWTFLRGPGLDGETFKRANRGCIHERMVGQFDGIAALMDREGCYVFDGGSVNPASAVIQDYFRPGRINWSREKWFHTCVYEPQETVKFFVCLTDSDYPRHAFCYHYRRKVWWVEEYSIPVSSSGIAPVGRQVRLLLGGPYEQVLLAEQGTLDGPSLSLVARCEVASATLNTLTIEAPQFNATDIAGAPVQIVAGPGKGQWRTILTASSSTGKLELDRPWMELPTEESTAQIGGIAWNWKTGWFRYVSTEMDTERKCTVAFQQTQNPGAIDIRRYVNHDTEPVLEQAKHDNYDGVTTLIGKPDATIQTKKTRTIGRSSGSNSHRWDERMDEDGAADRFLQLELRGWQNQDPVVIHSVRLSGVEK